MDLKKAILLTLLISIFLMGTVSAMDTNPAKLKTSKTSKFNKAKLKVSAPSVTNTYKKSQNFKVTVKNQKTGKAIQNVKVNIKIYTGKKYKTYNKKTNRKGTITINTKTLKKGTHNVIIKIKATKKYKAASAKSKIKITAKNTVKKIKTHFGSVINEYRTYTANGSPDGTYIVIKLYDDNGNEIHKPITAHIEEGYEDEDGFVIGVDYDYTSGEDIKVIWPSSNQIAYMVLSFKGDSKYTSTSTKIPIKK